MLEKPWRNRMQEIRRAKLNWILENIDVAKYDPYNPRDTDAIADLMLKAGAAKSSNSHGMVSKSIERLLKEARKIKGIKR